MLDNDTLKARMDEAEEKAIDSLSRYKFMMFGYWAAIWVHLNEFREEPKASPFKQLVRKARDMQSGQKELAPHA